MLVVAFREPALLDDLGLLVALAWIALPVSLVAFFSIVPHRIIRAVLRAVVVTIMFAPVLIVGHGGIAPVPVLLTWILPFERLFPGQSFVSFSVTGIVTLFVFGIVDEWREG